MAVGFGRLRLSPAAFWAMTPRELSAALGLLAPPRQAALGRAGFDALMRRFPDPIGESASPGADDGE